MDRRYNAEELLDKYRNGTADAHERRLVEQFMLLDMERNPYLPSEEKLDAATEAIGRAIAAYADEHSGDERVIVLRPWYRRYARGLAAAAAVVALLTVGWWFLGNRQQTLGNRRAAEEILPGGNRATLTLADGRTIDLSEVQEGIVVGHGVRYLDGSAVLDDSASSVSTQMSLTTPKGGTYQIALPDGSNVWLNANSTLKYPSRFDGKERVVELKGEAYFDVSQQPTANSQQASFVPFLVKTNNQTVEVLGTEFNISAYADDPVTKTTLVEGSVKVSAHAVNASTLLKPGEQGLLLHDRIETKTVDTEAYTAWRNGLFVFNETPLEDIMLAISRWYDVEVVYQDDRLRNEPFVGVIDRFSDVSDVLNLLEAIGNSRFQVSGRTIIVSLNDKSK